MKCPHCGAEINPQSRFCEACGSQISYQMQREQEYLNKQGCPRCHSSNIQFKRETQGEVLNMYSNMHSKRIIHRTVGYCKDCGYTWFSDTVDEPSKNNSCLWILGWILCWPIPVMILIWRKKNTWSVTVKIAVTIALWLFIIIVGSALKRNEDRNNQIKRVPTSEIFTTPVSDNTANNDKNSVQGTAEFYAFATSMSFYLDSTPTATALTTPELLIGPGQ